MTRAWFAVHGPLAICMLVGCGGGGGNPGTCSGSAEVCGTALPAQVQLAAPALGLAVGAVPANSASFVPVAQSDIDSVSCPTILLLNNGNKVNAFASAQNALARGANQLNRDKDRTACDEFQQ